MCVGENTSQAASVGFVRLRRTNPARGRLHLSRKSGKAAFSTVSGARSSFWKNLAESAPAGGAFSIGVGAQLLDLGLELFQVLKGLGPAPGVPEDGRRVEQGGHMDTGLFEPLAVLL